jgi:dihydrodipicolinate synthase/N-acetylneuraminate lyase
VPLRAADCRGVWVPLPTPFRDEALHLEPLEPLVESLLGAGIGGFLALGTTGEWPHLHDEEAEALVREVVRVVGGRVPVVAGSGRASTEATLALGERLARAGAEALLVITPHAYRARMDAEALRHHYRTVAAAAPVPVFVYHMPDLTGIDLPAELLAELTGFPNVWGFKDSSTREGPLAGALEMRQALGFVGSGARFLAGLQAGAVGGILSIANVVPEVCTSLFAAWKRGDFAQAEQWQERAGRVVQSLRGWGVAGIKAAIIDRCGIPVGPPRAPLRLPPAAVRAEIAAAIDAARGAS